MTTSTTPAVQRIVVTPFDPWDKSELAVSQSERVSLPYSAKAPEGWFGITPLVRARLAGLAVAVLTEAGPPPGRLAKAQSLFGAAFRGTFDPTAADAAARFYVEDPGERAAWADSFEKMRCGHRRVYGESGNRTLVREMLTKLAGREGVLATLRERKRQLDAILERLERSGGPA